MGFVDAVKSFFSRYVDFAGRSSRSEYWWVVLASMIVNYLIILPIQLMVSEGLGLALSVIFSLAVIIPTIALAVRRLHDTDKSGWWYLLVFIPILGWIALIVFFATAGTKGANRFGSDPLGSDAAVFN